MGLTRADVLETQAKPIPEEAVEKKKVREEPVVPPRPKSNAISKHPSGHISSSSSSSLSSTETPALLLSRMQKDLLELIDLVRQEIDGGEFSPALEKCKAIEKYLSSSLPPPLPDLPLVRLFSPFVILFVVFSLVLIAM